MVLINNNFHMTLKTVKGCFRPLAGIMVLIQYAYERTYDI